MYSDIIVPTDGSEASIEGVDVGLQLASLFGATVHALFVIDERFVADEYDLAVEAAEREAERSLDRVGRMGEDAGVSVEKHLRRGVPHREIVRAVEAYPAELVVMGTHGRSGFDRLVNLGSVAERVVRASPVPVVTVPVHSRSDEGASGERS